MRKPTGLSRVPYVTCVLVGLGGLFTGVTGPLLSVFVPLLVQDALGDRRTLIGAVMAIDNILLLLLVPWAGAASDRSSARGRGRRVHVGWKRVPLLLQFTMRKGAPRRHQAIARGGLVR